MTNDGRIIIGDLRGFDQYLNLVLSDCRERIFSLETGAVEAVLGLYVIRGDNLSTIGELDEALDQTTDWSEIKAEPLKSTIV